MTIGALYYHVIIFWINDNYPELEFSSHYDSDTAYATAAFGIKGNIPKGYVIAEREGERFEVLESYFPQGELNRFTMKKDIFSTNVDLYFDGIKLS